MSTKPGMTVHDCGGVARLTRRRGFEPIEAPMDDTFATHDVFNQSSALEDVNLFSSDRPLMEAVHREGAGHAVKRLAAFGQICGSAEALQQGRLANENPPRL